jgi:hypothetical protein
MSGIDVRSHPRTGQFGCLPDKEFRYLRHACYSVMLGALTGPGHFCLTPHVAMRIGLYLHCGAVPRVQSLRIPRSGFLLIDRTGWIVTADCVGEYHRILGVSSIQRGLSTASVVDRYSSRHSPYRYGAWTISSPSGFNRGALRMASEDSRRSSADVVSLVQLKLRPDPPERSAPSLSC